MGARHRVSRALRTSRPSSKRRGFSSTAFSGSAARVRTPRVGAGGWCIAPLGASPAFADETAVAIGRSGARFRLQVQVSAQSLSTTPGRTWGVPTETAEDGGVGLPATGTASW
jgi:hypothetical protein